MCESFMSTFQVESSPLRFTAEGQLLSGHVYVSSGVLQVPDELRCVRAADLLTLVCLVWSSFYASCARAAS